MRKASSMVARVALVIGTATYVIVGWPGSAASQGEKYRIGVVTLLAGPFAASIGVPAKNGAEMVAEAINNGTLPAPYTSKGVAGRSLDLVVVDESTGTTKQVTEFRGLAERRDVDAVVGYLVAGSCLAVAPVADELKMLTLFSTCSTPRIFEENDYKYVYRTSAHLTPDGVTAARYLLKRMPNVKTMAGLNWNMAYGQDAWRDFKLSVQELKPDVEAINEQFTTFGGGQYGAEISALLTRKPTVLHTAFAGGDFEAFVVQMTARGLHQQMQMVMTAGAGSMFRLGDKLPDGMIIEDRGPYSVFARPTPLANWFRQTSRAALHGVPHGAGRARPEDRGRQGGQGRGQAGARGDREESRAAQVRGVRDDRAHVPLQGPSGGDGVRHRGVEVRQGAGRAHRGRRDLLPGRLRQST
jgi:branched-chain amino acid transport system substrate-binding protein